MLPALAAGVALVNATVISDDQTQRNRWLWWLVLVLGFRRFWRRRTSILNGKRVHIRMQLIRKIFAKCFPTVIRSKEREAEQINTLIVRGIDPNLAKIKWARIQIAGALPCLAAIS